MKRLFGLILLLGVVLLAPVTAHAHNALFTYTLIDGDNLIMVTHNVTSAQAHLPVDYNLRLYTVSGELIDFDTVDVEVRRGSKVVEQQTLRSADQETNFEYTFPQTGNYKIHFSFVSHDKEIARGEAAVPVGIGLNDTLASKILSLPALLTLLIGAGITSIFYERRRFAALLPGRKSSRRK